MANAQNIQAKAAQVEEISKKIANAQSVIVFSYRGLKAGRSNQSSQRYAQGRR